MHWNCTLIVSHLGNNSLWSNTNTGDADYKNIPADDPNYATSRFEVSSSLPASRVLLVKGDCSGLQI